MSLGTRLFALAYDAFLRPGERRGMHAQRAELLAAARGRTLEIGAGTGLNLALYPDSVTDLVLTDSDAAMLRRLRRRTERGGRPATVVPAPAGDLPFADGTFDTVVCTLVLCTVADPSAALREIDRVLAPGGRLLVIEHVRAADPRLARRQDRWRRPWAAFAAGCTCNRETGAALRDAGFDATSLRAATWSGVPRIVRPLVVGQVQRVTATTRP
ncbi:class I SAM-dependent methyltransferase [Jatrophihabitans fulvus]